MAKPVIRDTSVFGIEIESTEGTYVAPSATTSYFQPEEDGFDFAPSRELLERNVMNNSIGASTPKVGMKSVSGSLSVEMRASGVEGEDVDFGPLLKSALGATRAISTTTTTKSSGNTGSNLKIEDADISKFNVGDIVVVKETGGHWPVVVTAVDSSSGSANISVSPSKASGNFANSVVISKTKMYFTANSGHSPLSLSYYWGNQIRQAAIGAKVKTLSLDNFSTGKLATFNIGWEGLTYTEIDGAAPHTPAYDTGAPPVILQACVFKDGVDVPINTFGLNLENTLGFQTETCSANGKVASRVVERKISGTLNPYMDDTATDFFTLFNANTEFSLFVKAFIPSSTAGELVFGSVVAIYLPKCIVTEYKKGDLQGLITDEVSFQAVRGVAGSTEEMYLGLI